MVKEKDFPGFETLGEDIKTARQASHKLKLCPEQYLPFIVGAIIWSGKIEETEG